MKMIKAVAIAGACLSGVALGMTVVNSLTWPRGKRRGRMPSRRKVSILIPARNEADTIEACVRAARDSEHPVAEVIVCDDQSTDGTTEILQRMQEREPATRHRAPLKVIQGTSLPDGWAGKPHACHNLYKAAQGDVLLYIDADTFLDYEGVSRIASLFAELDADIATAVPRQITVGAAEKLILPLLHLTYTSWFPIFLTWRSKDHRFLAANGQVMAITREAYEETGGFEAIKAALVDDMELCKRAKKMGYRVVFADGDRIAECRMYTSWTEIWEGFSKNIYPGLGASKVGLAGVLALYGVAFVSPYALVLSHQAERITEPNNTLINKDIYNIARLGLLNNLMVRALLAKRHQHSFAGALLHPFGVMGLMAIALNSARWYERGQIRWSGRVYASQ